MTARQRDGNAKSPFSDWLRSNRELDSRAAKICVIDIDWCIHQYATRPDGRMVQNVMFCEEKTHGAEVSPHQRDTLRLMAQIFGNQGKPVHHKVHSSITKGPVTVRNFGYHLLTFSGAGPLDSAWIRWDHKPIHINTLTKILSFQISPITLQLRDERSHHGGGNQMVLPLAGVA